MAGTQAVLGAVALIVVAVALILALTILVLMEMRWILSLWAALRRTWNSTVHQVQDSDLTRDRAAEPRGQG
jgi:hypothetical protein